MDIDIDSADRDQILKLIKYVPASIKRDKELIKHNTGVHVTKIPVHPFDGLSSIDYITAEQLGYIKLDLLNVHVYEQVNDRTHLDYLLNKEPNWQLLQDRLFVEKVIHINNHYDTMQKMPEPIDSVARMAMFLAVIRPAKRHLIGKPWKTVAESVWEKPNDDSYYFKKSHSVSYAHLVKVHMNLLSDLFN